MISSVGAEQVPVRYAEGVSHGFLVLRTQAGETIADGDLTQTVRGSRVTDHLVFRFKDGSLHEETTTFSQRDSFRLLTDRIIQKGPSFTHPTDTQIDSSTGEVTVQLIDHGRPKTIRKHFDLPADVANGLMLVLVKNIVPNAPQTTVGFIAASTKIRLVKLVITPQGAEAFSLGTVSYKAVRYDVKIEIGGAAGVVAPLVGKQPPDTHVWVTEGEAPAFLKSEGALFDGGPIWSIELALPKPASKNSGEK
jgi:hypothetical protein